MTEPTDAAPLTVIDLMRVVMDADNETRGFALRGSTNWAAHIGKAVQNAVLAKWGTPAPVGVEPVAWLSPWRADQVTTDYDAYGEHGIPLYTTPQPTHAQAVNQADRPFIVRLAEDFAEECVTAGYVTTKAASYGRLMDEALSTQAQAGAVPLTCEWTHNDDDGYWDTSCGKAWRFDDGGPKENNMHFCHCCGKTLRIKGGQHGAE